MLTRPSALKLFSLDNAKTVKGEAIGWLTHILYLSPHTQNSKGKNLCPMATELCKSMCISRTGRMNMVSTPREKRTEFFIKKRGQFIQQLFFEIGLSGLQSDIYGYQTAFRLNGTSDILWERMKLNGKSLMEHYPERTFFDYTKIHTRIGKKDFPENYNLTFSWNGEDLGLLHKMMEKVNCAVVFRKIPDFFAGYPVHSGDEHDLRFLDPKGHIIGLRYKNVTIKGFNNKQKSQFVIEEENPLCVYKNELISIF